MFKVCGETKVQFGLVRISSPLFLILDHWSIGRKNFQVKFRVVLLQDNINSYISDELSS